MELEVSVRSWPQQVPTGYRLALITLVASLALSLLAIVDLRRGFL
jgi:hypothetical protein